MNKQQDQKNIVEIILWVLLTISVTALFLGGFRFFQLSQLIPDTDGLKQVIVDVYPYDPEIELPLDADSKIQIIIDSLDEENAARLSSEYLGLSNQIDRLYSLINNLVYIQFFLLFLLLISLGLGISQTRKHDLLVRDYRNLRNQYQKLLGSKKIVDAELKAAREYIFELEKEIRGR